MSVHKSPEDENSCDGDVLNPFDPARLRISQRTQMSAGVDRKVLGTVQVRRPSNQEYFRVHPGNDMRLDTVLIDVRTEGAHYLVAPEVAEAIPGDTVRKALYTVITRQGTVLLWPVRLPDEQGRLDSWNSAAHQAAAIAETSWTRIVSNRGANSYDIFEALDQSIEPQWPEGVDLQRLLELAFRARFIDSLDHKVVRQLMGEI